MLDTNVVLALYWFRDPRLAQLADALQAGQLRWLATSDMREELVSVLQRLQLASAGSGPRRWQGGLGLGVEGVLLKFDQLAILAAAPQGVSAPRCTDTTDQVFIELALASRTHWLLSRDRAVLKLRRKLLELSGCRVRCPEGWPG